MAAKPALRAVAPDETPEPKRDLGLSLSEAIVKGDRLQIEYAQRRDIASKLDGASGPAAAALHRQLSLTNDKIDALESRDEREDDPVARVEDGKFDAAAI
ncbi:hypothetical protein ACSBPH_01625 [Microbacterium sp. F51-2R]|uniref:hypothetical protein n=1 Tax=Microbacterium sp. F51-2R TaxID=3445777 RepID=UPI003F9FF1F2